MCLSLNILSFKKTAKHDIEVFKILSWCHINKAWITPYRRVFVDFSTPMKSRLQRNFLSVDNGIHSYSTYNGAVEVRDYLRENDFVSWIDWDKQYNPFHIFKAIIPKGEEYYVGNHYYSNSIKSYVGSHASSKLIITDYA